MQFQISGSGSLLSLENEPNILKSIQQHFNLLTEHNEKLKKEYKSLTKHISQELISKIKTSLNQAIHFINELFHNNQFQHIEMLFTILITIFENIQKFNDLQKITTKDNKASKNIQIQIYRIQVMYQYSIYQLKTNNRYQSLQTLYQIIESVNVQTIIQNYHDLNFQFEKIVFQAILVCKPLDQDCSFSEYFCEIGILYLKSLIEFLEQENGEISTESIRQLQLAKTKVQELIKLYFIQIQYLSQQSKYLKVKKKLGTIRQLCCKYFKKNSKVYNQIQQQINKIQSQMDLTNVADVEYSQFRDDLERLRENQRFNTMQDNYMDDTLKISDSSKKEIAVSQRKQTIYSAQQQQQQSFMISHHQGSKNKIQFNLYKQMNKKRNQFLQQLGKKTMTPQKVQPQILKNMFTPQNKTKSNKVQLQINQKTMASFNSQHVPNNEQNIKSTNKDNSFKRINRGLTINTMASQNIGEKNNEIIRIQNMKMQMFMSTRNYRPKKDTKQMKSQQHFYQVKPKLNTDHKAVEKLNSQLEHVDSYESELISEQIFQSQKQDTYSFEKNQDQIFDNKMLDVNENKVDSEQEEQIKFDKGIKILRVLKLKISLYNLLKGKIKVAIEKKQEQEIKTQIQQKQQKEVIIDIINVYQNVARQWNKIRFVYKNAANEWSYLEFSDFKMKIEVESTLIQFLISMDGVNIERYLEIGKLQFKEQYLANFKQEELTFNEVLNQVLKNYFNENNIVLDQQKRYKICRNRKIKKYFQQGYFSATDLAVDSEQVKNYQDELQSRLKYLAKDYQPLRNINGDGFQFLSLDQKQKMKLDKFYREKLERKQKIKQINSSLVDKKCYLMGRQKIQVEETQIEQYPVVPLVRQPRTKKQTALEISVNSITDQSMIEKDSLFRKVSSKLNRETSQSHMKSTLISQQYKRKEIQYSTSFTKVSREKYLVQQEIVNKQEFAALNCLSRLMVIDKQVLFKSRVKMNGLYLGVVFSLRSDPAIRFVKQKNEGLMLNVQIRQLLRNQLEDQNMIDCEDISLNEFLRLFLGVGSVPEMQRIVEYVKINLSLQNMWKKKIQQKVELYLEEKGDRLMFDFKKRCKTEDKKQRGVNRIREIWFCFQDNGIQKKIEKGMIKQLIWTNYLEFSYSSQRDTIIMKIKSGNKKIFLRVQSVIRTLNVSVYDYNQKNADYTRILDSNSIKTFQNLFRLRSGKMLEQQLKQYLNNNFIDVGNKLRVLSKIQIIQSINNYQQLKLRCQDNIKLLRQIILSQDIQDIFINIFMIRKQYFQIFKINGIGMIQMQIQHFMNKQSFISQNINIFLFKMRYYHSKTKLFKFALTLDDIESYLLRSSEIQQFRQKLDNPKSLIIALNQKLLKKMVQYRSKISRKIYIELGIQLRPQQKELSVFHNIIQKQFSNYRLREQNHQKFLDTQIRVFRYIYQKVVRLDRHYMIITLMKNKLLNQLTIEIYNPISRRKFTTTFDMNILLSMSSQFLMKMQIDVIHFFIYNMSNRNVKLYQQYSRQFNICKKSMEKVAGNLNQKQIRNFSKVSQRKNKYRQHIQQEYKNIASQIFESSHNLVNFYEIKFWDNFINICDIRKNKFNQYYLNIDAYTFLLKENMANYNLYSKMQKEVKQKLAALLKNAKKKGKNNLYSIFQFENSKYLLNMNINLFKRCSSYKFQDSLFYDSKFSQIRSIDIQYYWLFIKIQTVSSSLQQNATINLYDFISNYSIENNLKIYNKYSLQQIINIINLEFFRLEGNLSKYLARRNCRLTQQQQFMENLSENVLFYKEKYNPEFLRPKETWKTFKFLDIKKWIPRNNASKIFMKTNQYIRKNKQIEELANYVKYKQKLLIYQQIFQYYYLISIQYQFNRTTFIINIYDRKKKQNYSYKIKNQSVFSKIQFGYYMMGFGKFNELGMRIWQHYKNKILLELFMIQQQDYSQQ